MPKVLVTSGSTRVAYALCCSLAKNGFEVYIGEQNSFSMAGMSRYCTGRMTYPAPFTQQQAFVQSLADFIREKKIDIIMPVLEETYTCLKHKHILEETGVGFLFPEYEKVLQLHAKGSLTNLAKELNVDTPPTWELTEILENKTEIQNLPFPLMLKPKQGGGGWDMQKFTQASNFLTVITTEIENPSNYIVQAIIEGELIGACGIYHQGKHIVSDSYSLTTAYPLRVGQSTTRLSHLYPSALTSLKALLDHLNWNGVCQMDFIFEEKTGKSYLIDANPRFWGSVKHNIAAGVDYPLYYALLAQNNTDFIPQEARIGTRTRWLGGDIFRVLAECKESEKPLQYIRKAIFSPVHYTANDDWNIKDPLPFFTWATNLVLNKLLHRKKDSLPGVWE